MERLKHFRKRLSKKKEYIFWVIGYITNKLKNIKLEWSGFFGSDKEAIFIKGDRTEYFGKLFFFFYL